MGLALNTQSIMSNGVIIIKRQNDNKSSQKSYGRWYPRVFNLKTLTLDDVCQHIMEHGTIFTSDVVYGVTRKFVNCIQELLLSSHKVKLDGLGTFYLKPRLKMGTNEKGETLYGGAETMEELDIQNVVFSLGFTPERSDRSLYLSPVLSRNATRVSATTIMKGVGLTTDDDSGTSGSGQQQQGGGTSGSVEEQP